MEIFWYAILINLAEVSQKSGYRQATGSMAVPSVCSTHLSQASQITGSAAISFIFGYTDFPPASSVCWSLARGRQRKFSLFFSHYWDTYYGSEDTGEWNTESTDKDLPDQVRRQVTLIHGMQFKGIKMTCSTEVYTHIWGPPAPWSPEPCASLQSACSRSLGLSGHRQRLHRALVLLLLSH